MVSQQQFASCIFFMVVFGVRGICFLLLVLLLLPAMSRVDFRLFSPCQVRSHPDSDSPTLRLPYRNGTLPRFW
jgi:hypothetical protein